MATIRKRFGKWQIQIRRQHYPLITKTFLSKKTAEQWDRKIGNEIDKGVLNLCKKESTLRALVDWYISEISSKKRGYFNEKITLEAFKREKFVNFFYICSFKHSSQDFWYFTSRIIYNFLSAICFIK